MQTIFLAVAALLASDGSVQTRSFCDDLDCFSVTTLTEDAAHDAPLFWFVFHNYEEFRTEAVEPYKERCRYDDLLVVFGDEFVPPAAAGTFSRLEKTREQALKADALITVQSYRSIRDYHRVLAHEWGHYLHEQYCLAMDPEGFASAVAQHFSGAEFDTRLVR